MNISINASTVAWLATFLCTLVPARCAKAFLTAHPRLFTAMALLALSWALLLPYYDGSKTNTEMLPAFVGFLHGYIGVLLQLEAQSHSQAHQVRITNNQTYGLWAFLAIVAPSAAFQVKGSDDTIIWGVNLIQGQLIICTALTLIGYWSLAIGCKALFSKRLFLFYSAAFAIYSISEISFTISAYQEANQSMSDTFKFWFALEKIIVTIPLCFHISSLTFSEKEKSEPLTTFIIRLMPAGIPR
jgi:hypothetical protein